MARGRTKQEGMENHAWNIVKIAKKAYQIDVTWDLNRKEEHDCPYYYFNLPDKLMSADHYSEYQYPHCLSIEYMYSKRENQLFINKKSLLSTLENAYSEGRKLLSID